MKKQITMEKDNCHTGRTYDWPLPEYKKSHTDAWEKDKQLSRIQTEERNALLDRDHKCPINMWKCLD